MYKIVYTAQMKQSLKRMKKCNKDISKLKYVLELLVLDKDLPPKYKDHNLTGNYCNYRECHIEPDWLLVYKKEKDILILTLVTTGTHSDLFK